MYTCLKKIKFVAISFLLFTSCFMYAMEENEEPTEKHWVRELDEYTKQNHLEDFLNQFKIIIQYLQTKSYVEQLASYLNMINEAALVNNTVIIQCFVQYIKLLKPRFINDAITLATLQKALKNISENLKEPCKDLDELLNGITNHESKYKEKETEKRKENPRSHDVATAYLVQNLQDAEKDTKTFDNLIETIKKEVQKRDPAQQLAILLDMLEYAGENNTTSHEKNLTLKKIARFIREVHLQYPTNKTLSSIKILADKLYKNPLNKCAELRDLIKLPANAAQSIFDHKSRPGKKENQNGKIVEKDLNTMERCLENGLEDDFTKLYEKYINPEELPAIRFDLLLKLLVKTAASKNQKPNLTIKLYVTILELFAQHLSKSPQKTRFQQALKILEDTYFYNGVIDATVLDQILTIKSDYGQYFSESQIFEQSPSLPRTPSIDFKAFQAPQENKLSNEQRAHHNNTLSWKKPLVIECSDPISFCDIFKQWLFVGSCNGEVKIYDLITQKYLRSFDTLIKCSNAIPLGIIPGNLETSNDNVFIVNQSINEIGTFATIFSTLRSLPVFTKASSNEYFMYGDHQGTISLHNCNTAEHTQWKAHEDEITVLHQLPNNHHEFLSASADGTMKIWNIADLETPTAVFANTIDEATEKNQRKINAADFPGGHLMSLRGKQYIQNWDTKNGSSTIIYATDKPNITSLTSFQNFLIGGKISGKLKVWNKNRGFSKARIVTMDKEVPIQHLSNFDDNFLVIHYNNALLVTTKALLDQTESNQLPTMIEEAMQTVNYIP